MSDLLLGKPLPLSGPQFLIYKMRELDHLIFKVILISAILRLVTLQKQLKSTQSYTGQQLSWRLSNSREGRMLHLRLWPWGGARGSLPSHYPCSPAASCIHAQIL